MKKLNLNVANLGATEMLSREELKRVLGGTGTGSYIENECDTDYIRDSTGKIIQGNDICPSVSGGCTYFRYNYVCDLMEINGTCTDVFGLPVCKPAD